MDISQLLVSTIFISTILALIFTNKRPATVFSAAVLALLASAQLDLETVTQNLTNHGLVILVLLILISTAIDKTSMIRHLARKLISSSYSASFWRLFGLTFASSALLNNTAVVASLISPVKQNIHHPPSKLLIPLSYAAILGGTVTLIGTSTNLIVNSFLIEQGHSGFSFWDFTLYGLTAGLSCGLLLFALRNFLPDIKVSEKTYKEYIIETQVSADSPLVGKSVEQNHLRSLPELFLVEIVRQGTLISPVTPSMVIESGDKLIFSGNMKRVDSLSHIEGLNLYAESNGLLMENLTEVVVSNRAKLIGKTLKESGFRSLFDAAVVAIRRDGHALSGKLGDIKIQAGDFLLLATGPDFSQRNNLSKNFFILSEHRVNKKLTQLQEFLTIGGFLFAISLAAFSVVPLALSLIFFIALMLVAGIINSAEIKRSLPINLIMIVVGALSLASALEQSGVISSLSGFIETQLNGFSPFCALVTVYFITLVLTELVTNNAAAALSFPFAYGVSQLLGLPVLPFALAVALAASASFISPYGYQTNLLVFSASNYKLKHFAKIGLPISIFYSVIVLSLLKYNFNL